MTNAFLCHTPYHLTIAERIASGSDGGDAFLFADFPHAALLAGPFGSLDRVLVLPGNAGRTRLGEQLQTRRALALLRRAFAERPPTHVFVAQDDRPEGQWAVRWARRAGARLSLFEDGSAAYVDPAWVGSMPAVSGARFGRLKQPARWLLTGTRWRPVHRLGTFIHYDDVWLTRPEMALCETDGPVRHVPPPDRHAQTTYRDVAAGLFAAAGLPVPPPGAHRLLLLDHPLQPSASVRPANLGRFLDALADAGPARWLIKQHPRDSAPVPDSLLRSVGDPHVLPSTMPAEWVPALTGATAVLAGITGALLTATWADPAARPICLAGLLGLEVDPRFLDQLRRAGVEVPLDLKALTEALA